MGTPSSKRPKRSVAELTFSDAPPRLFGRVVMEERIPSRLSLKNELIGRVLETLRARKLVWEQQALARWRLCLDEALVNAIVHGNNGDPRRYVSLKLLTGSSRWAVLVEDEGEGFSEKELPRSDSPHALYSESGRGVLLMRQFVDEVRYYGGGSSLMLVKSRGSGDQWKSLPEEEAGAAKEAAAKQTAGSKKKPTRKRAAGKRKKTTGRKSGRRRKGGARGS